MKNLYIVRHGKSTWDLEGISDIDRPLKERGINDGYVMAKKLLSQNRIPEIIMSSPAARALHSATIFARTFIYPYSKMVINEALYLTGTGSTLVIIQQTDDDVPSLMIFGHNPTFTDLANYFVHNEIDNIPTTGIVGLQFETISWKDIKSLGPKDWFFDFPKNN